MPATVEEKRAKARERQRRFQENRTLEQKMEDIHKHRIVARRSYYKKRLKAAGTGSLKNHLEIKKKTLKTATLSRKAKKEKQTKNAAIVLAHYTALLSNSRKEIRKVGMGWFRVMRGWYNPYSALGIDYPIPYERIRLELFADLPSHWRFHDTNLTKNYHPYD